MSVESGVSSSRSLANWAWTTFFQLPVAFLQNIHDLGVERFSRLGRQPLHGFFQRQRAAVLTVGSQRVQDSRPRRECARQSGSRATQAERIARAIPFFVMGPHDGHHRIGKTHALQDLGADHRMDLHLLEFFRRQASRLGDDVFRHGQLANVMQKRGGMQALPVSPPVRPSSFATSMA